MHLHSFSAVTVLRQVISVILLFFLTIAFAHEVFSQGVGGDGSGSDDTGSAEPEKSISCPRGEEKFDDGEDAKQEYQKAQAANDFSCYNLRYQLTRTAAEASDPQDQPLQSTDPNPNPVGGDSIGADDTGNGASSGATPSTPAPQDPSAGQNQTTPQFGPTDPIGGNEFGDDTGPNDQYVPPPNYPDAWNPNDPYNKDGAAPQAYASPSVSAEQAWRQQWDERLANGTLTEKQKQWLFTKKPDGTLPGGNDYPPIGYGEAEQPSTQQASAPSTYDLYDVGSEDDNLSTFANNQKIQDALDASRKLSQLETRQAELAERPWYERYNPFSSTFQEQNALENQIASAKNELATAYMDPNTLVLDQNNQNILQRPEGGAEIGSPVAVLKDGEVVQQGTLSRNSGGLANLWDEQGKLKSVVAGINGEPHAADTSFQDIERSISPDNNTPIYSSDNPTPPNQPPNNNNDPKLAANQNGDLALDITPEPTAHPETAVAPNTTYSGGGCSDASECDRSLNVGGGADRTNVTNTLTRAELAEGAPRQTDVGPAHVQIRDPETGKIVNVPLGLKMPDGTTLQDKLTAATNLPSGKYQIINNPSPELMEVVRNNPHAFEIQSINGDGSTQVAIHESLYTPEIAQKNGSLGHINHTQAESFLSPAVPFSLTTDQLRAAGVNPDNVMVTHTRANDNARAPGQDTALASGPVSLSQAINQHGVDQYQPFGAVAPPRTPLLDNGSALQGSAQVATADQGFPNAAAPGGNGNSNQLTTASNQPRPPSNQPTSPGADLSVNPQNHSGDFNSGPTGQSPAGSSVVQQTGNQPGSSIAQNDTQAKPNNQSTPSSGATGQSPDKQSTQPTTEKSLVQRITEGVRTTLGLNPQSNQSIPSNNGERIVSSDSNNGSVPLNAPVPAQADNRSVLDWIFDSFGIRTPQPSTPAPTQVTDAGSTNPASETPVTVQPTGPEDGQFVDRVPATEPTTLERIGSALAQFSPITPAVAEPSRSGSIKSADPIKDIVDVARAYGKLKGFDGDSFAKSMAGVFQIECSGNQNCRNRTATAGLYEGSFQLSRKQFNERIELALRDAAEMLKQNIITQEQYNELVNQLNQIRNSGMDPRFAHLANTWAALAFHAQTEKQLQDWLPTQIKRTAFRMGQQLQPNPTKEALRDQNLNTPQRLSSTKLARNGLSGIKTVGDMVDRIANANNHRAQRMRRGIGQAEQKITQLGGATKSPQVTQASDGDIPPRPRCGDGSDFRTCKSRGAEWDAKYGAQAGNTTKTATAPKEETTTRESEPTKVEPTSAPQQRNFKELVRESVKKAQQQLGCSSGCRSKSVDLSNPTVTGSDASAEATKEILRTDGSTLLTQNRFGQKRQSFNVNAALAAARVAAVKRIEAEGGWAGSLQEAHVQRPAGSGSSHANGNAMDVRFDTNSAQAAGLELNEQQRRAARVKFAKYMVQALREQGINSFEFNADAQCNTRCELHFGLNKSFAGGYTTENSRGKSLRGTRELAVRDRELAKVLQAVKSGQALPDENVTLPGSSTPTKPGGSSNPDLDKYVKDRGAIAFRDPNTNQPVSKADAAKMTDEERNNLQVCDKNSNCMSFGEYTLREQGRAQAAVENAARAKQLDERFGSGHAVAGTGAVRPVTRGGEVAGRIETTDRDQARIVAAAKAAGLTPTIKDGKVFDQSGRELKLRGAGSKIPSVSSRENIKHTFRHRGREYSGSLARNPSVPYKKVGHQELVDMFKKAGVKVIDNSYLFRRSGRQMKQLEGVMWHGDSPSGARLTSYCTRTNNAGGNCTQGVLFKDGTLRLIAPLDQRTNHSPSTNHRFFGVEIAGALNGKNATPAQLEAVKKINGILLDQLGMQAGTHGQAELTRRQRMEGGPNVVAATYGPGGVTPLPHSELVAVDSDGRETVVGKPIAHTSLPAEGKTTYTDNTGKTTELPKISVGEVDVATEVSPDKSNVDLKYTYKPPKTSETTPPTRTPETRKTSSSPTETVRRGWERFTGSETQPTEQPPQTQPTQRPAQPSTPASPSGPSSPSSPSRPTPSLPVPSTPAPNPTEQARTNLHCTPNPVLASDQIARIKVSWFCENAVRSVGLKERHGMSADLHTGNARYGKADIQVSATTSKRIKLGVACQSTDGTLVEKTCSMDAIVPFVVFVATPTSTYPNQPVELRWATTKLSTTNQQHKCTVFGPDQEVVTSGESSGGITLDTISESSEFVLMCDTDTGPIFRQVEVDIITDTEELKTVDLPHVLVNSATKKVQVLAPSDESSECHPRTGVTEFTQCISERNN